MRVQWVNESWQLTTEGKVLYKLEASIQLLGIHWGSFQVLTLEKREMAIPAMLLGTPEPAHLPKHPGGNDEE